MVTEGTKKKTAHEAEEKAEADYEDTRTDLSRTRRP